MTAVGQKPKVAFCKHCGARIECRPGRPPFWVCTDREKQSPHGPHVCPESDFGHRPDRLPAVTSFWRHGS